MRSPWSLSGIKHKKTASNRGGFFISDLTVKQLYTNALRFALGKFLPNLGILAIIVGFDYAMFLNPMVGIIGMLLIGFTFPNFLSTYYAYFGIDKYIVQKVLNSEEAESVT